MGLEQCIEGRHFLRFQSLPSCYSEEYIILVRVLNCKAGRVHCSGPWKIFGYAGECALATVGIQQWNGDHVMPKSNRTIRGVPRTCRGNSESKK